MPLIYPPVRHALTLVLSLTPSLLQAGDYFGCQVLQSLVFSHDSADSNVFLNSTHPLLRQSDTKGWLLPEHGFDVEVPDDYSADESLKTTEQKGAMPDAINSYSALQPDLLKSQASVSATASPKAQAITMMAFLLFAWGAAWYIEDTPAAVTIAGVLLATIVANAWYFGLGKACTDLLVSTNTLALNSSFFSAFIIYLETILNGADNAEISLIAGSYSKLTFNEFVETKAGEQWKGHPEMRRLFNELAFRQEKAYPTPTNDQESSPFTIADVRAMPEFQKYQRGFIVSTFIPAAAFAANGIGMAVAAIKSQPVVSLIAAQGLWNRLVYNGFGKPLSDLLMPEVCNAETTPSFIINPLHHVCYQARWLILDYGGYILAVAGAVYRNRYLLPGLFFTFFGGVQTSVDTNGGNHFQPNLLGAIFTLLGGMQTLPNERVRDDLHLD